MSCEKLPEPKGLRLLDVEKKVHPFLVTRLMGLEALLDNLLENKVVNPKNLHDGLIADLGTGSGSGLLALRRKTLAPIFGVDREEEVPHVWSRGGVDHYCGAGLKCPEKGVTDISATSFVRDGAINYLSRRSYGTYSLITMFYIGNFYIDYPNLLKQCGLVLRLGGQLLITSDVKIDELSRNGDPYVREWGSMTENVMQGGRTLSISGDLISQLGGLDNVYDQCKDYKIKDDLKETNGRITIKNIRDQSYWVFTKTS